MMHWNMTSGPAAEPITLAEAKAHLRVDISDDDALIATQIAAARQWVEAQTGRALITQSWRLTLDAWPEGDAVSLVRPPVQAVTAIRTIATGGAATIWTAENYALAFGAEPQRLLRLSAAWPAIGRDRSGIEIDLTCGYGAAAAGVPAALRQATLLKLAQLYERRGEDESPEPDAGLSLLAPYRTVRL
jgi:uncharacterized phiE125 gp8 family phage protein